jgi:sugar lactone lactonase YvrE
MRSQFPRILVVGVASLVMAACSGGDEDGPKGSDNTVSASVAPAGAVSVYLNKPQSVSIKFGTSDGRSASALSVSGGLASLPVGWTGPAGGFECPVVGAGATCTLSLQYLPTTPATGTFALGFSYRANNGAAKHGSVAIDYSGLSPTLELLAGSIGGSGNLDGTGAIARFWYPGGIAGDSAGTLYVADSTMIRKVTREGDVTTLAGAAEENGFADGAGVAARFNGISGIAVDRGGTLYVSDTFNDSIRTVSPQGFVTTLAGSSSLALPYDCRFADGVGVEAAFCRPGGVAVDSGGTVYVADTQNAVIRKITPAGVVTTLAGGLVRPRPCDPFFSCTTPGQPWLCPSCPLFPPVDGVGGSARFGYPHGIAVDGDGTVYVADGGPNHSTIRKITPAGVVTTLAGRAGTCSFSDGAGVAAEFCNPQGIAVDGDGTLYVADQRNNAIRRITPAGVVTTLAGDATAQEGSDDGKGSAARFSSPAGVAVGAGGVVHVADSGNHTIREITPDGVVTTLAGAARIWGFADDTGAAARFGDPVGVAVDSSGVAYVADCNDHTIRKVAPNGAVTTLAGSPYDPGTSDGTGSEARFNCPSRIAVDDAGTVYVSDSGNNTIRMITPAGFVTTLAGRAGPDCSFADGVGVAAEFCDPVGIAVDDSGTLYVADSFNTTIRRITREGVVTTLAGSARSPGAVDGAGDAARFFCPIGVAVGPGRRVFVAEGCKGTIRRIDPPDVVTTVAAARFDNPVDVAVDPKGNLYVADSDNHTIRKVTPAGVVTTILGEQGSIGIRLGTLPASLSGPFSVALRPDGQLVIADGSAILVTRGL